ncbi:MAG TPA: SGNH/GDSL hydrolase family protein [Bacteroidia bacterium]|jgi:hypothetical protein|nr:SGNH/GDSL hydrolase family protein [Bacteroidia bacterium]
MKAKIPSLLTKLLIIVSLCYLYNHPDKIPFGFMRIAIIILSFIFISQLFHIIIIKSTIRNLWKNSFLLVYILLLFCVVCELFFTRYSKSHAISSSLASVNWLDKYWHLNSLGYRDLELDTSEKRKKIFFIGDSFTAGYGADWTMDRFSNTFASKATNYKMYNLGVSGSDTRDEFKRLQSFPMKPDVVIWQYFGNDIEGVLKANNVNPPEFKPYEDVPEFLSPLVDNSYFFNFVYWQFPHPYLKPFFGYLTEGYKNENFFEQHLEDLEKIILYCRQNNIKLVVVLFPYLQSLEGSNIYVPRISKFFLQNAVPVLNVTPLVRNMSLKERIVNNNDVHPSVKVHHIVGETLYELCKNNKIIE